MIITIDGPTASGKSTIARLLAKRLKFYYLNSGLLYRAVAYLLVNNCLYKENNLLNPRPEDLQKYIDSARFLYDYDEGFKERILFDGENITPYLKTSFMDKSASVLSANKMVRDLLLKIQRVCAQKFDIVAEGRDMGSVVFPEANFKFFLTASVQVRAQRWIDDQQKLGNKFFTNEAIDRITERDKRDKEREIAPLSIPQGAIIVDNSDLNIQETLDRMVELLDLQA